MNLENLFSFITKELKFVNIRDENSILPDFSFVTKNGVCSRFDAIVIDRIEDVDSSLEKLDRWGALFISAGDEETLLKYKNSQNLNTFSYLYDGKRISVIFKGFNKKTYSDLGDDYQDLMQFVQRRKLKPESLSLVFVAGDRDDKKELLINESSKRYHTEVWFRNDRFRGTYWTFSQIVNESLLECKNEFIVWIHPRVTATFEMVDELLLLVCSGYGMAAEINWGLFVATKQLFRRLGMVDERFLGGECEDLDWFFRMKYHGIPFFERGNEELCPWTARPWGALRGLSHTLFDDKWIRINRDDVHNYGTDWALSKFYEDEKKLIDFKSRPDIESSWGDSSISHGVTWISDLCTRLNFLPNNYTEEYVVANSMIELEFNEPGFRVTFLCDEWCFLMMTIHDPTGKVICGVRVPSNTWHGNPLYNFREHGRIEVRINVGENRIYHNMDLKVPCVQKLQMGLKIKRVTGL